MTRHALTLIVILPFLIQSAVQANELRFAGKVMKVTDGDTVVISSEVREAFIKCRLYGIDAPETSKRGEPGQPYGDAAAIELKHMVLAQNVEVVAVGKDRYKRDICFITLDGLDVNLEMVKRGYAWAYRKYLKRPYFEKYVGVETEARKGGLGLWHDNDPEPPWDYRKRINDRNSGAK